MQRSNQGHLATTKVCTTCASAICHRNVLDSSSAESPGAQWVLRQCKKQFPDLSIFLCSNARCASATCILLSGLSGRNWVSS